MAEKENRCWPGYEPVPGKKPHSEESCRPKPDSRSTPAQKKVKAKRRKELDRKEAEHKETKHTSAHKKSAGTKKKSASKNKSPKSSTTASRKKSS